MHELERLQLLDAQNIIHDDLHMVAMNKDKNSFRYLSESDFEGCTEVGQASVCQKREIRIEPKVGCNLKDNNCVHWTDIVVHDITNTQILMIFQTPHNATLSCDFQPDQVIALKLRQLATLNVKCSLQGHHFTISKMSYRQMQGPNLNSLKLTGFSFSDDLDFMQRNHKQEVLSFMKGTKTSLSEMESANRLLAENIQRQTDRSEKVWAEATGGMSATEQLAMWAAIAGSLALSLCTILCMLKLTCTMLRINRGISGEVRGGEDIVSDLRNRLLDLEADILISKSTPAHQNALVPRARENDNMPDIEEAD